MKSVNSILSTASAPKSPSVDPTCKAELDLSDEELMERMQEGDEDALASVVKRHRGLLRTVIGRIINNDFDVDDLIQECLLEIWRNASHYDAKKGHALAWIVTIARRRTIDRIRRKTAYRRAQERFREEAAADGELVHCAACDDVERIDRAEAVSRLIAELPEPQQEAVHLAYFRGMTHRQIAAHTGIPMGTIKTRLELALRKLHGKVLAFRELYEPMSRAA